MCWAEQFLSLCVTAANPPSCSYTKYITAEAVADIAQQSPEFDVMPVLVGFVVDKVERKRSPPLPVWVRPLPPVYVYPQMLPTHLKLYTLAYC